jgi:hypothetical protein
MKEFVLDHDAHDHYDRLVPGGRLLKDDNADDT